MVGSPQYRDVAAVVVAAGKGLRAGQPVPKQFATWRGKPVIRHSVEALRDVGIATIIVVIPEGVDEVAANALSGIDSLVFVTGGETRQASVRCGLEALANDAPARVLVHDAARPALPRDVIDRLLTALDTHDGAIPVLPVADSMLVEADGMLADLADRTAMRRVQTPQAFRFQSIIEAHRAWQGAPDAGDDAQVAHAAGVAVELVAGDEALQKLTFANDFDGDALPMRVGNGYDVHRLAEGEELWLGGVQIEHSHGLAGHSDADVVIHALVDAMLGAVSAGDIGAHFPPSDPQWAGAASSRFLEAAGQIVAEAGYRLGNADLTIICEAPRIGPHRDAMRAHLSTILGVDIGAISVKATTSEKLGFTGREEGIAAQAIVNLIRC